MLIKNYFEKLKRIVLSRLLLRSGLAKYYYYVFRPQYLNADHNIDCKKLSHYIACMDLIEGWFLKEAAQLFAWIDYIQKKEQIEGNLFEIGVHKGKSTIMLGLMKGSSKERVGACDSFIQNEKNIFMYNFKSYFDDIDFLSVYEKPSNKLTTTECGKCRFFHIDGGHSADEIFNDLCLAEESIVQRGIIVIDDVFNVFWPGVMEGTYKFLTEKKLLSPLLIGFNKLVLCKVEEQKWYLEKLTQEEWEQYIKVAGLKLIQMDLLEVKVGILGVPF